MTKKSFDPGVLEKIKPAERSFYSGEKPYIPYESGENLVPGFLPVTNSRWQVRFNASTHGIDGILGNSSDEVLANTLRLDKKTLLNLPDYTEYHLDEQEDAETLILSYGISAAATKDAVNSIRQSGRSVSLLIVKTILPVPRIYYEIAGSYKKVIIVEENINAQFAKILFGDMLPEKVRTVGSLGKMISSRQIIDEEVRP